MNSLKLILQFARQPNEERLCGEKNEKIYDLLKESSLSKVQEKEITNFIKKLYTVNAFTKSLGKAYNKNQFEEEPVKAYIFGYSDWENINKIAIPSLKKELKNVPLVEKKKKIENLPENVPLNHNFLVLYFGALFNPNIPTNFDFLDKCKVSLGKVLDNTNISYNALNKNYNLEQKETEVTFPFFDAKPKDYVFTHHNTAFWKATPDLMTIYNKNLEVLLKSAKANWK